MKFRDTLTLRVIDHSYDLVHKSLTKKMQSEITQKLKQFINILMLFNNEHIIIIETKIILKLYYFKIKKPMAK
jgi:hypothetical protein